MISKVVNGIYRGPRPDIEDYAKLKEYFKVRSILNLEDDEAAISSDKLSAYQLGMSFYSVKMSEIWRPKKSDLLACVRLINDKTNQPIFVHCLHGQDRTGYVIAAYRMLIQGWTFDAAYQEAKDMGHNWWFAPYLLLWPRSLQELISSSDDINLPESPR